MRDLTKTITSILLAGAPIALTYTALGSTLIAMVEQSFNNLPD